MDLQDKSVAEVTSVELSQVSAPGETLVPRFGIEVALYDKSLTVEEIWQKGAKPLQRSIICEPKRSSAEEKLGYDDKVRTLLRGESSDHYLALKYEMVREERDIWTDGTQAIRPVHDLDIQILRSAKGSQHRVILGQLKERDIVDGSDAKLISHPDYWMLIGYNADMQERCALEDKRIQAETAPAAHQ